jgi:hypothetical protein
MRSLVVAALGVAFSIGISAQAPEPLRKDTMHLTVLTSISGTTLKAGDKVSVTFDIKPKRNMHVYAPGKHDYQVIAVKIDPQPWLKVAPTTYPPSEIYYFKELDEKVETYGHPFKLVQDMTILNTPAAKKALASGTAQLTGKLEYQACDDKVCYAPTKIPVTFDLTVE